MDNAAFTRAIDKAVLELSDSAKYHVVFREALEKRSLPSVERLREFIELTKSVLFPGFFGIAETSPETIKYHLGFNLQALSAILAEQALYGLCFECGHDSGCNRCESKAEAIALAFIDKIPEIRSLLSTDVEAAFDGDPAAKSHAEIIYCYPSIKALIHHRIAHELLKLGLPVIPRVISEMAHSETGIDIHPGATLGERFFIDHGTGTVIGETCVIGRNVRLYQGVTLGAKSFPKDAQGNPVKGIPRHPVVEDDVIVYSGATVLGRITIGRGAVVAGNQWVTEDVPAGAKVH